jgi:hypothetical protein
MADHYPEREKFGVVFLGVMAGMRQEGTEVSLTTWGRILAAITCLKREDGVRQEDTSSQRTPSS